MRVPVSARSTESCLVRTKSNLMAKYNEAFNPHSVFCHFRNWKKFINLSEWNLENKFLRRYIEINGCSKSYFEVVLHAPDKGSFPLDHFHECDKESEIYNKCVIKHQLMPKRCRQYQIDYLQCRMKRYLI